MKLRAGLNEVSVLDMHWNCFSCPSGLHPNINYTLTDPGQKLSYREFWSCLSLLLLVVPSDLTCAFYWGVVTGPNYLVWFHVVSCKVQRPSNNGLLAT
jgi:hypothetical protein